MRRDVDMCHGPLLGGIIRYTVPIIFTGLLHLAFNAADLIVVGRFCGSLSIAAVGATGSLVALFVNLFNGMSIGAGVAIAHAAGAKNDRVLFRTVHTAMPLALIFGVVITLIGWFGSETILGWMGTPEDVLPLSALYFRIYSCGLILDLLYNYAAAILRAMGDTKGPLLFLTASGVLNVALNLVFVLGFDMGVAGVALATVLSKVLAAVLAVGSLMRRNDACKLYLRKMRFYKKQLFKILRIGVPAGIQSALFAISNILIQSSINSLGSVVMSGNAASANIEGFIYTAQASFATAAMNFVGQNVGAGDPRRVRRAMHTCLACVTVVGMGMGGAALFFGKSLLGIYITDSAQAIEYGLMRMTVIALTYFLCGWMDVVSSTIRGLGTSLVTMIVTVLGVCGVRILWIYTVFQIPQFHTSRWLYFSYPISWAVTFLTHLVLYHIIYGKWKAHLAARKESREAVPENT